MNKMQKALRELSEMDELAARASPIHALHPAAKLLATIAYIAVTLSFDKYDLSGIIPMVLWPILLFQLSGIEVKCCFYKLRVVLPLVTGPRMLMTRNLLYTAVTRAKKLVVIVGRESCVSAMVENNHVTRRYSALADRLVTMCGM